MTRQTTSAEASTSANSGSMKRRLRLMAAPSLGAMLPELFHFAGI
jgi:hypothetical protein